MEKLFPAVPFPFSKWNMRRVQCRSSEVTIYVDLLLFLFSAFRESRATLMHMWRFMMHLGALKQPKTSTSVCTLLFCIKIPLSLILLQLPKFIVHSRMAKFLVLRAQHGNKLQTYSPLFSLPPICDIKELSSVLFQCRCWGVKFGQLKCAGSKQVVLNHWCSSVWPCSQRCMFLSRSVHSPFHHRQESSCNQQATGQFRGKHRQNGRSLHNPNSDLCDFVCH